MTIPLSSIAASDFDYTSADRGRLLAEQSDRVNAETKAQNIANANALDAQKLRKDTDKRLTEAWNPVQNQQAQPMPQGQPQQAPQAPQAQPQSIYKPQFSLGSLVTGETPQAGQYQAGSLQIPQAPNGQISGQPVAQPQVKQNFPNVNPLQTRYGFPALPQQTQAPQAQIPQPGQYQQGTLQVPQAPNGKISGNPVSPSAFVDHPAANLMSDPKSLNLADTSAAARKGEPDYSPVQITPMGTFDRGKFIQGLIEDGHGLDAFKWQNQFKLDDANAEKQKLEKQISQGAREAAMVAEFQSLPDSMKADAYQIKKKEAQEMGIDTSSWPATFDPNNKDNVEWMDAIASHATSQVQKWKEKHDSVEDNIKSLNAKANYIRATKDAEDWAPHDVAGKVILINKKTGDVKDTGEKPLIKPTASGGMGGMGGNGGSEVPVVSSIDDVPAGLRSTIAGVGNGKILLEDFPTRGNKGQLTRGQVLGYVTQIYPGWDARLSIQQKKTIVDYAPNGSSGKAIGSINTIVDHNAVLRQSYNAMKNGDIPLLNALANKAGVAVGKDPQTTYNTMLGIYAGELDKFMSGNNPTEGGRKEWESRLSANGSSAQVNGSLDVIDKAAAGKLAAADTAYYNATSNNGSNPEIGKHLHETGLLNDASKSLLQKAHGGSEKPSSTQAPQIKVGDVPRRSNGSVLPDGKYKGFSVVNGKVASVGGE